MSRTSNSLPINMLLAKLKARDETVDKKESILEKSYNEIKGQNTKILDDININRMDKFRINSRFNNKSDKWPNISNLSPELQTKLNIIFNNKTEPKTIIPIESLETKLTLVKKQEKIEALEIRREEDKARKISLSRVDIILPANLETDSTVFKGKANVTYEDLNKGQRYAVELAKAGKSFCLIGAAGSGKTTVTKMIAKTLEDSGIIKELEHSTKNLEANAPSIVFVSFTNQAVTNIRTAVPENFKDNCLTMHKVLEYAPFFWDEVDEFTGETRKRMKYIPYRDLLNPIYGLTHVVFEESGSINLDLFHKFISAIPNPVISIFLGDLNQIPPVFGDAILGFKLLELPVVELTHSYRTDKTSPIRLLAYKILEGHTISDETLFNEFNFPGELEIKKFKDKVEPEYAVIQMGKHLAKLVRDEYENKGSGFDCEEDVVLIPFRVKFGSIELNKYIATEYSKVLNEKTYEIISGYMKVYYAVGDLVYVKKNKWRIVDIVSNPDYIGKFPNPPSLSLNRWGEYTDSEEYKRMKQAKSEEEIESAFNLIAEQEIENEKDYQQATHIIVLEDCNGYRDNIEIKTSGDINVMYLAYCLTIHKAMGSEWEKVFCIFHHSHSILLRREILYTAITRPRKKCIIYYSGEEKGIRNRSVFQRGILNQFIPGKTLHEKLEYFKHKHRIEILKLKGKKIEEGNIDLENITSDETNMLIDEILKKKSEETYV